MRIALIGHVSKDINVVKGTPHVNSGGGVFYGSIAAQRLGAEVSVYTKCAEEDRALFGEMAAAGVRVVFLPSRTSTSIRNVYPSDNPDERTSTIISQGEPAAASDLALIEADALHINPLWYGEFPPELIEKARSRPKQLLAGDAQGFLRIVQPDGQMKNTDWSEKRRFLPFFDVFKVDSKEAKILTGFDEPRQAARAVRELGPRTVLLTHQHGVSAFDGSAYFESPWSGFTLEGRTGRGDTCTAAFLVSLLRGEGLDAAVAYAARVTSAKMQYKGPYRG